MMKVCSVFGVKNKNSTLGDSSSHIVTSAIKQFAWPVQKRVILNSVNVSIIVLMVLFNTSV